ncbi:MAG: tetratricopeptide repeat protein [Acidobacteria bacterium]|nr:tetratricopeptide repeat protein [Acidobacteriota bacterium]
MTAHVRWRAIRAALPLLAIAFCSVIQANAQDSGPRPSARARIEGRVAGPDHRPVQNVRVQVLNDGYSVIGNFVTDGGGRFSLTVPPGSYYIDVEPIGLPFERQRQRIELDPSPFQANGEMFRIDITLEPLAAGAPRPAPANSVVFAQTVPKEAQQEFQRAEKLIKGSKSEEAIAALQHAIELFPEYYLAMETLGTEYVKAEKLMEAHPVLTRALEINPNGAKAHYAIGVLYYKANKQPEAIASFTKALELDPDSQNTVIYLGLAQMRAGQNADAETNLERAYKMGARKVPELHLALASIYMKDNRYQEAITEFERLLSENPGLRDRKKIEELIATLKAKAKANPKP